MEQEFIERIKELKSLYEGTVGEMDYRNVIAVANFLEDDMESAGLTADEIYEAVYPGFFARYYLVRKYERTAPMIGGLVADVSSIYHDMISGDNSELKIKYGYLLSLVFSELAEDPAKAEEVGAEVCKLAEENGDFVSLLREFNSHGLREKKLGNFEEAIRIFSQVEEFVDAPEATRHIANIINNRGLSMLEMIESFGREKGDINISLAMEDLIKAGRLYLSEEEISRGHLTGILNRFDKARKLIKGAKREPMSSTDEWTERAMSAAVDQAGDKA